MKRILLALACTILWIGVVAALPAGAEKASHTPIKELMGENLVLMKILLIDLMKSNYDDIPSVARAIRSHANDIAGSRPDSLTRQIDKDRFDSYAIRLKSSTDNLITVTEVLRKRVRTRLSPGELKIDYLRSIVAEHYAAMVAACVNCHNQFRHSIVIDLR